MKTVITYVLCIASFILLGTGTGHAQTQLSGSYTIDPSGSGSNNYTSVSAAATALMSNGVSGAVTFTIKSGTYNGQVTLSSAIAGASATNTITFKGRSGNRAHVIIANTGTYTLYMTSVDHVTFEDLTIQHSGTYGIYLRSNADNNTFDNVKVTYTASGRGYNIYNYQSEFNTFNDCYVENGYMGIFNYGWNTSSRQEGTTITNSEFYNQTYYGIYSYYGEDLVMDNVVLDSFLGNYPLYVMYNVSTTLANSKIIAPSTGVSAYWYYDNYYGSSSDTSKVYNNMLLFHGSSYGLYANNMYRNKWHSNSISMAGSAYGAYMPYPNGSEFYNNNWYAKGGTYGIYMYQNGTLPAMDYNNLDWNGTNWGVVGTYAFRSLTQQQGQYSAANPHSLDVDPEFDSATNLRTYAASLNNKGTKKSHLTKNLDIDGNKRPATGNTKYDIGCNEYYLYDNDLDVKAIISPASVRTGANTITANLKNTGGLKLTSQSVTFEYSVDSGKTWTGKENDIVTLDISKSYNFTFTQTWTPTRTGNFRIGVRISKQVTNDPDAKDEWYVDVCSGLAGTFTVGRPSSSFPTLAAAFKKLECGLAGHTTFQLEGGNGGTQATYGQIKLQNVMGTSANATLTIDGQNPDSVKLTRTNAGFEGVIDLNNCSYINFTNLTIDQPAGSGAGVHVWNGSHHNSVVGCEIVSNNSTTYDNIGIALTGNSYRGSTITNNNVFENNLVSGQYYAINSYSAGGNSSASSSNVFKDNLLTDYYYYGLYVYYNYNTVVDGNKVINPRYRYNYPFYWYYNSKSEIKNNTIGDYYVYSMRCYYENANSTSDTSLILNNLVNGESGYTSTTYGYGTYFYNPYNLKVWHNTFVYDAATPPANATGTGVGAAFKAYYGYNWDIQNNIFHTPMGISGAVPLFLYNPYSVVAIEGNNYSHPNGIVANISGNNLSSIASLQSAISGHNTVAYSEPIHFVGNGDYHLSTAKQNLRGANIGIGTDIDGDQRCAFAPSIGADESGYPTPTTRAFFASGDTVYVKSPTQFSNAYKTTDPVVNDWYVDRSYVGSTVDLEYKFQSTGTYTVKVVTEGCGGLDSFKKKVVAILPTKAPSADFISSHTIIDVDDVVSFTNLTTNGPESFVWSVNPGKITGPFGIQVSSHSFVGGTNSNSTNPQIEFLYPGTYNICLRAENFRGVDNTCKSALITVRQTDELCGVNDVSTHRIGKLFDEGGPDGNYIRNRQLCTYLIDPCTDEIKLTFHEFNLASGSVLRIYDGKNNLGKPLYDYDPAFANGLSGDMTKLPNFKKNLTATSGEVFVEFSSGNAVASGFELEWEGRVVAATTPVVDFALPDTICANVSFAVVNNTQGLDVDYEWTMDNANTTWYSVPDYDTEDITHQYNVAGTYHVKLHGENCGGKDSLVDSIVVIAPKTAPTPSFTVSNSRPAIGDAVTFTDASTSKIPCIGKWEWSVSPSTYAFAGGFSETSQNPQILFQDTGYYDVTLKVTNSAGSNSYTMTKAVYSISVCVPSVKITGTKVGISRVVIGDIDNSSNISSTGYESYTSGTSTVLEMGASYDITIERPTGGTNPMNRAVWVDYNQDGVFDDVTELVAKSTSDNNQTWTGTFTVATTAVEGLTRLRVGANLGNFKQYGCGPNQFGEFEDYRVRVTDDSQPPVIVFLGAQDTTIEQCSKWTDPGAYGWDNVNGRVPITGTFGNVSTASAGTYKIIYYSEDKAGNIGQGTRTVKVVTDYTNPVITIKGSNPATLEVKSPYTDAGADADDNCGGNISADVTTTGIVDANKLGTYVITYDVTDDAGNSSSITRDVKVVDTQAPALTLNGKAIDTIEVHTIYTEAGVTATDNYDQNLDFVRKGNVDVNTLGTYELKYTASDLSGNVSNELTRIVVVIDGTAPVIRLAHGTDTTILVEVYDKYTPEYVDIDDNYSSEAAVRGTELYSGTYVTRFGTGITTELGDYTFTYTYEDESGNVTSVTRDIKVVDTEAPTAILADGTNSITLYRWDSFDPLADVTMTLDDNFYDKDVLTTTFISSDVNTQSTGQYQVVYEIADPSGNIFTYTVDVTVADNETTIGVGEANIVANIYPNPTNGQLNINVDLLQAGRVRVSVINSLGQEVVTVADQMAHTVNQTVDLSTLGSGVYYVQIISGNDRLIEKVTLTD